jgi:serine phosphatase RsbU (regulator of sigma subunit)
VATTASTRPLGVLLIEDDDDDALIVADLLADEPIAVELQRGRTLGDGLERLPGQIECVLLDLHLPDAVGLEGVRRVRAVAPWIAVIVLTGLDDAAAGEAAVEAGAQDYLIKGKVDAGLLARAIRYAVGRRHADDVLAQLRVAEIRADETARLERGLVPHPIVTNPAVWVASRYLPGRRRALIGGDFYDVVEVSDGTLHVVIGDVSGRGPDEAALGAALRIAWRALTLSGAEADGVLPTLQTMIEVERQDPGTFATVCTLRIDPADGHTTLRRAGHPAPVLLGDGAATSLPLDGGGPPIGMFSAGHWPAREFSLGGDWSLLLYTDGVIEGRDTAGELLGEDGLRRIVADTLSADREWRADPSGLLGAVLAQTRVDSDEDGFADDVALLALGARPEPRVRG